MWPVFLCVTAMAITPVAPCISSSDATTAVMQCCFLLRNVKKVAESSRTGRFKCVQFQILDVFF
jgi:hypothetical protein